MLSVAPATVLPPQPLGDVANSGITRPTDRDQIGKVASDFESLFASQILKEMRKTLDSETMFAGDSGDVYGGMFDMFLGNQMAQNGGFGLAKMLTETLRRQETAKQFDSTNANDVALGSKP